MGIVDSINIIGNKMVMCTNNCEGIACNPNEGILPRGLMFDNLGNPDVKKNRVYYCWN